MERSLYEWAKEYHSKGYQVIPIQAGGKKPLIPWQAYQKERVSEDLLKDWFHERFHTGNIGVITGSIWGLGVVDFDLYRCGEELYRRFDFPDNSVVRTGSGGIHVYCRFSPTFSSNRAGILPGLDTRGEGGYVVAPPSRTKGAYCFYEANIPEISDLPRAEDIPGLPEILLKGDRESKDIPSKLSTAGALMHRFPLMFLPASEGSRNHTAARVCGLVVRQCNSLTACRSILRLWNRTQCKPPLSDEELQLVLESIYRRHHNVDKI